MTLSLERAVSYDTHNSICVEDHLTMSLERAVSCVYDVIQIFGWRSNITLDAIISGSGDPFSIYLGLFGSLLLGLYGLPLLVWIDLAVPEIL